MPSDTEIATTVLMDEAVAEDNLATIKALISGARSTLYQAKDLIASFDNGQGWRALGFPSLAKCLQERLGIRRSWSYELVTASKTAKVINSSGRPDCPIPGKPPAPLELTATASRALQRLPESERSGAMAIVQQRLTADSRRKAKPSAKLVGAVVDEIIEESAKSDPVQAALLRADVFVGLVNDIRSIRARIVNLAGAPEGGCLDKQACAADLNNVVRALNFAMPMCGCPECKAKGCKVCKERGWVSVGLSKALEKGAKK